MQEGEGACHRSRPHSKKRSTAALAQANARQHELATLEHLLLALIDDVDAAAVMSACNVDLAKLRTALDAISKPT